MSFRKSLSWLGAAQLIGLVLQFGTSIVFARYLTPHEMGVYAIAVALVGLLSVIQQLSLPALIIREETITEDFVRTAFTVNAAITVLFSLVIVAAALFGSSALKDPGVRDVLLVLALSPLFGIVSFLPTAQLEREGRFKQLALIGAAAIICNAVAGTALVVAGFGYMSIAYAQLLYSAVYTGLALWAGRAHARFRLGVSAWRRVLGFSMQTLAISGMHTAGNRTIEILMGRIVGLSALGLYNRASGLNNLIWQNIASIVARVVLVDFAESHRNRIALRDRYLRTVAVMTGTLWPAFAGLAVIARPFIVWVYGARWEAAIVPLAYLAISSIILSSISMTWEVFTATGRMREQMRVETIRVVTGTGLFAIGCLYGLEAAAATRILDSILAIFIYRPYLDSMTGTSRRDFRGIYLQGALVTLLAIAPAALLLVRFGPALPSVFQLGCAIVAGGGLWLLGLALLGHPAWQELRKVAMATYNGAAYLPEQLASLAGQTEPPAELVVSDDGSSDGTLEIVRRFADRAPFPVRILDKTGRLGFADNFLFAAENCRHDVIAPCDQDDVWLPRKLEIVGRRLHDDQSLVALHTLTVTDGALRPTGLHWTQDIGADGVYEPLERDPYLTGWGNAMAFRRELVHLVPRDRRPHQPEHPERPLSHDTWLYILAAALGRVSHIAEPLILYRQHGSNAAGVAGWRPQTRLARIAGADVVRYREKAAIDARMAAIFAALGEEGGRYAAAAHAAAAAFTARHELMAARARMFDAPSVAARLRAYRAFHRDAGDARPWLGSRAKSLLLGVTGLVRATDRPPAA